MNTSLEILEDQYLQLKESFISYIGACQNMVEFTNYIILDKVIIKKAEKIKFQKLNTKINNFYNKLIEFKKELD